MLADRLNTFFKSDQEKVREAEKVLELLKDSPAVAAMQREREDARLETVRGILAERERVRAEHESTMPALREAVVEAQANEKAARDRLQAAERETANAEHRRLSASLDYTASIDRLEAQLRKHAPEEIDQFISAMRLADDKARLALRTESWPGAKNVLGVIKEKIFSSNTKAIAEAREYIKRAIEQAESMKLDALSRDEIIKRLDTLKAGLPNHEGISEAISLPLPDVAELRRA